MDISQIIEQDLKGARSAFKNEDFIYLSMFGYRIMANSIQSEDVRFPLVGFYIRELAGICERIKANKDISTFATAKSLAESYLDTLNPKAELKDLWEKYYSFCNRIRMYEQSEHEKGNYEENSEFTAFYFRWLIERLSEDRNTLLLEENRFISGIFNEMSRVYRVHGGRLVDLYALSLARTLELYYGYMRYLSAEEKKKTIQNSLFPYIDDISRTLLEEHVDQGKVANLMMRMIVDWRLFFIYFMERPALIGVPEGRVPITEETKRMISETVKKTLEKEVK